MGVAFTHKVGNRPGDHLFVLTDTALERHCIQICDKQESQLALFTMNDVDVCPMEKHPRGFVVARVLSLIKEVFSALDFLKACKFILVHLSCRKNSEFKLSLINGCIKYEQKVQFCQPCSL